MRQIELFNERNATLITPDVASSQLMKEASAAPPVTGEAATLSPFSQSLSWSTWDANDVLTSDITCSRLHVVPLSYCSLQRVAEYLDPELNPPMKRIQGWYHSVCAFRPTGWVGNTPRMSEKVIDVNVLETKEDGGKGKGKRKKAKAVEPARKVVHRKTAITANIHHIPYSEHSSYSELQEFVRLLADCGMPEQGVTPTVNVERTEEMLRDLVQPIYADRRRRPV